MTEAKCPKCGNEELWSGDFNEVYCRKCSFIYLCWNKSLNRIVFPQKLQ